MSDKDKIEENKFVCSCGSVYYKSDSYVKLNHWTRCACGERAFWDSRPSRMVMTKFIKGYTGGYNEALGVDIKSKEHYNQVVKEKGAIPIG